MLLFLYRRRLRAHPVQELLAGSGVAIGVALVFGVLLANASLTSSAGELVHGLAGSARFALVARSSQGFEEGLVEQVGNLPGVEVASPVLRENVTLIGPRGQEPVQLIGVTASLEALGGVTTQQLSAASVLQTGGLGLPTGVAQTLGAKVGSVVRIASDGRVHAVRVRALLGGNGLGSIAASPVAVAVLPLAQSLARTQGRVSEILVKPHPGARAQVGRQLERLAAGRIDVRPADDELRLLDEATKPNRQSTALFSAISVMIGFLLALNAILLTVPERRRFVAELRMQGYDPGQILLLLGVQALVLGLLASLVGIALGDVLSRVFFERVPGFLSAAFPLGTTEVVRVGTVLLAVGCGVLATALAALVPVLDLRRGRPADAVFREGVVGSEVVRERTIVRLGVLGGVLIVVVTAFALLAPSLTIVAGVVLAVAMLCLIPAAFWAVTRVAPWCSERMRSSALIVALAELRATTTRSVALAGIVALAVYGGIAIGGARNDLLRGIGEATDQYFSTAQVWVTSGSDVFNTNSFAARGPAAALARAPGVASVRIYQGGLLDVGDRRMWLRVRPAADVLMLERSQLLHGDYSVASSRIRSGGWVAVSSGFAEERGLHVGDRFLLPTPSGFELVRVAAIVTNSGWPPGAITLGEVDYSRWWGTGNAAALEVSLKPGVGSQQGRHAVRAALGGWPGLQVRTAAERAAQSSTSARQGLRTLEQISTLLLVAAALAVASALSATIWQRRARLAALKIQGYDVGQLWRAVLIESAIMIAVGSLIGAIVGVFGHALASRWLELTTGFPAPFAVGIPQVLVTIALLGAITLAVLALPGMAAARVPPTGVLQE
jgi:putative ABC transport system permease protein